MSWKINYIPLSFINTNEEISKQIKNSVLFGHLLSKNEETTLAYYLESTQYGYTDSAQPTGSHKLVRITDIRNGEVNWDNVPYCDCDKEDKYLLNANDILVARTGGTTGKSFFVENAPGNAVFASYLIRLRLKEGVDVDFINAFLNSYVFWSQIVEMKSGSAMPNVNAEKLKTLRLPKCDNNIQKELSNASKGISTNPEFLKLFNKIKVIENYHQDSNDIKVELTHQLSLVKQLRQSFLREAMQGKLIVNDKLLIVNEETGADLLTKIKAEKEQLIKEKKIRKQKPLHPITEDEIPFKIPENWVWCRLGDVSFSISTGPFGTMLHKSDYVKDGIPLINPMNLVNGIIIPSKKMMVDEKTKNRLKSYILKTGDIVIGRRGEMGRCAVVTEIENGWLCGTGSFFLNLHHNIFRPFFVKVLSADFTKELLLSNSVGSTMNNLNHRILNNLTIPLPPLSEQKSIVAKLDELMAYCDSLETHMKNSQIQNEMLLGQVLREALEPKMEKVI